MPGGLGSTHKVLILGKGVGTPAFSAAARIGCGSRDRDGCPARPRHHDRVGSGDALSESSRSHSWNTPICWTGFILFADSVVWRKRGNSWLRSAPARVCRARAAVDSALGRVRRLQPDHRQLVLHRAAVEYRGCVPSATHGPSPRFGRQSSKARTSSGSSGRVGRVREAGQVGRVRQVGLSGRWSARAC